jgi:integrase
MLISSKLDPLTVARRVGHANPTTTMRVYAHMWRQTDDAAANAAEAALRTSKER